MELATRSAEVRLEPSIVGRPPTAEVGHRFVVGIYGSDRQVVLSPSRRRDAVIIAETFHIAACPGALISRGPDGAERFTEAAADNGVDQSVGHAVITLPFAVEAVGFNVAAN